MTPLHPLGIDSNEVRQVTRELRFTCGCGCGVDKLHTLRQSRCIKGMEMPILVQRSASTPSAHMPLAREQLHRSAFVSAGMIAEVRPCGLMTGTLTSSPPTALWSVHTCVLKVLYCDTLCLLYFDKFCPSHNPDFIKAL